MSFKEPPCDTLPSTRPDLLTDHSAMETSTNEVSAFLVLSPFTSTMATNQAFCGDTSYSNNHTARMFFFFPNLFLLPVLNCSFPSNAKQPDLML